MHTLRILAVVVGTALAVAAFAAFDGHRHGAHGLGKAAFCSRLTDEHVRSHTAELNGWVVRELNLTPAQQAALTPLTDGFGAWAHELSPVCDLELTDGPSHVAALVQLTDASQRAVARLAVAFNDLYAILDDEQRRIVDGWMTHDHHGFHDRGDDDAAPPT